MGRIVGKDVGFFKTEAKVRVAVQMAVEEGIKEVIWELKAETVKGGLVK